MTTTIISKQDINLVQNLEMNQIVLTSPAIINLNVSKEDVVSMSKNGNDLIVQLKNGEKIVLKNFVAESGEVLHTLVLTESPSTVTVVQFDEAGNFTDYLGQVSWENLLISKGQVFQQVYLEAEAITETEPFSLAGYLEENGSKVGLGVAAIFGIGPLLLDSNDNKSSSSVTPEVEDTEKPDAPSAVVSEDGTKITGKTEANATILLVDATRNIIATVTADGAGNYEISIPEQAQSGESLSVYAQDAAKNTSTETKVTGKDNIAPEIQFAQMNDAGTNITGKSEASSNVYVYDASNKLIASMKSNATGDFSVVISPAIIKGETVKVIVEDQAGNKSTSYDVSPEKDTTPPDTPTKFEVATEGNILKGFAEANANISLRNSNGDVLASGRVNANGEFTLNISPALTKDDIAELYIIDLAGNQSKAVTITLTSDTIAPNKPTAILDAVGSEITGTAEANATVYIKSLDNKTVLGTAIADSNGQYKITLTTPLTDKTKVNITVQDKNKNESEVLVLEGIDKDTIAPAAPTITEVKDNVGAEQGVIKNNGETDDTAPIFSGKGEVDAIITIYDNGKMIGTSTVNSAGNWEFTPSKALELGEHTITLYQTDKAGNMSIVSSKYVFTIVENVAQSEASILNIIENLDELTTTDQNIEQSIIESVDKLEGNEETLFANSISLNEENIIESFLSENGIIESKNQILDENSSQGNIRLANDDLDINSLAYDLYEINQINQIF